MEELDKRRNETSKKYSELKSHLSDANKTVSGKACVYATGSYGRKEAGGKSDLDLFIVGLDRKDEEGEVVGSVLNNLDAICVKSALIKTTRALHIPEFDGDGKYLDHFYVNQLIETLGTPKDDSSNTFAARLLLLLESTPITEGSVYNEVIGNVIARYWRDFEDHALDFIPAFLANDILRLWRSFCVSYEANAQPNNDIDKAKRKTKNYKLKHSRLLTCFSALLYLLTIYNRQKTVSPTDVVEMVRLTPTERLEWLLKQQDISSVHEKTHRLLSQYNTFLINTSIGDAALKEKFRDKNQADAYMADAFSFGDTMSEVLGSIGEQNRFRRLLIV